MPSTRPDAVELRNLFDFNLDMLAIARDGYLVFVNPAWEQTLGWSPAEITAEPFVSFVHDEDLAITRARLRHLVDGESSDDFRNRLRHKDGGYRSLQWSLRPSGDTVYLGARDVTAMVDLQNRLARSEAIAVAVLHTAADPIIIIDVDGTIMHVNEATTELFGHSYDEMMGQNVSMLMPEPYRSEHDGYLERYLRTSDPRIIGIGREVTGAKADGTTFPMSLAVSEATTETDHLFTGIIHDLTERNRQRDELTAANATLETRVGERTRELEELLNELKRSNRDLEQFAYIASHDLQAPLRNVRQGLELLDEHLGVSTGEGFDEEAVELRDLVVRAALRMEELIRGLLAYSRVQREPRDERESCDLTGLVGEVVAMLQPEIDLIDGSVDFDPLPTAVVNPVQIRQVFQNLIENSIRYRSTKRPLRMQISSRQPAEGGVVLTVQDNGCGVDPAHHERIFELFRRGHSGYQGVGLGLAICRRIAEAHGGSIWVESDIEEGATFCIQLPPDVLI